MDERTIRRAELHAALGEPARLAIVDELAVSDRTSSELCERFGLPTNLLAHHLSALERVGLIERAASAGDRRRRYVRLVPSALSELDIAPARRDGPALFVCTQNSARSLLAAALWRERTGTAADSAGTHPADRIHPGAVAAAKRHGLDLSGATPRQLDDDELDGAELVVTVCDRAHEELARAATSHARDALHWSVPDPAIDDRTESFDHAVAELDRRISTIAVQAPVPAPASASPATPTIPSRHA